MATNITAWFYGGTRAEAHASNKQSNLGGAAEMVTVAEAKKAGIDVPARDTKGAGPVRYVVFVENPKAGSGSGSGK